MALNSGKILMRRGQEVNFDPNKMTPGEWAVSLDSKYVRMCFSPGVCVRMATYDAFEADMVQIQRILTECQTIEEAVNRINDEISVKAQAVAEYTAQAKQYRDEAEQFRNEAFSSTPEGYLDLVEQVGENTRKIAEGVGGVSSYNDLENKPTINDVELNENKTLDELGIASKEALEETDNKVNIIIENAELRFKETASGENIHLDDSADSKFVEFGLYGKAVQNGTPTPQNPVEIEVAGASGSVEVKSVGKNLLEYPYQRTTIEVNGINFTDNGDGTITANGTATALSVFYIKTIANSSFYLEKGNYILSGNPSGGTASTYKMRLEYGSNKIIGDDIGNGVNVNITSELSNEPLQLGIMIYNGQKVSNLTFKPMIRHASDTDSTYEPYKSKTATIPTQNGIAGIKVDSNGNYTDKNGQQWICDEVVKYADGSGALIQRVGKYELPKDSDYKTSTNVDGVLYFTRKLPFIPNLGSIMLNSISSHFTQGNPYRESGEVLSIWAYSDSDVRFRIKGISTINDLATWLQTNTVEILYELPTPITTPLTAEQLAEIEKLKTFYPITNISNDFDCGMKVKYIADAKSYIDNRLALIEQAMLNSI